MGVGKAGVDQMGVGQMVPNPIYCYSFYLAATQYSTVPKKRNYHCPFMELYLFSRVHECQRGNAGNDSTQSQYLTCKN